MNVIKMICRKQEYEQIHINPYKSMCVYEIVKYRLYVCVLDNIYVIASIFKKFWRNYLQKDRQCFYLTIIYLVTHNMVFKAKSSTWHA